MARTKKAVPLRHLTDAQVLDIMNFNARWKHATDNHKWPETTSFFIYINDTDINWREYKVLPPEEELTKAIPLTFSELNQWYWPGPGEVYPVAMHYGRRVLEYRYVHDPLRTYDSLDRYFYGSNRHNELCEFETDFEAWCFEQYGVERTLSAALETLTA